MKKEFHDMLTREVGVSPVSHPFLREFLRKKGFRRRQIQVILSRYFTPTINHYKLKPWSDE